MRKVLGAAVIGCVALSQAASWRASAQAPRGASGEWRHYAGDLRNHHYSPLDQINAANFSRLEVAWRLQDRQPRDAPRVQARRHAADGERRALHDRRHAPRGRRARRRDRRAAAGCTASAKARAARPRRASCPAAALAYWTDGSEERILYVTPGYRLVALEREDRACAIAVVRHATASSISSCDGLRQPPADRSRHRRDRPALRRRRSPATSSSSAPRSAKGSTPRTHNNTKGLVRGVRRADRQAALDVQHDSASRRVRQRHVAERLVGRQRQHRRLEPDQRRRGARPRLPAGRNADLATSTAAIVPATISSPRASSRVDLKTGQAQVALPAGAPSALEHGHLDGADPRRHQRERQADQGRVDHAASRRWIYVFDRVTGQPVWPIEERPVPQGDVPGEWYSPTQPFPTKPPPYDHQGVTVDDLIDFTPELRAEAVEARVALQARADLHAAGGQQGRRTARTASGRRAARTGRAAAYDPETHVALRAVVHVAGAASG